MGQLLVVQGSDSGAVERLFARALRLFESLCGLTPCDRQASGTTAVAKFPRLSAPTTGIVRAGQGSAWICGAGTFFDAIRVDEPVLGMLLDRLPKSGESALTDLNGIFAIARHDPVSGILEVITDRLGSLHIYQATIDSCLVISTSSMVMAALLRPRWDLTSCREFLATGTVFEHRTLWQGIEKLAPATVYRFERGRERGRSRYWDLRAVAYDRARSNEHVERLADALEKAISTLARHFARPVMDLTGGFDSRALLGAMLRTGSNFATVVNGNPGDGDVVTAARIAEDLGLRHRHQVPQVLRGRDWWGKAQASLPLCDGEYDVLAYARTFDVQSRLASEFDISINGSNGEICKGYWWELLLPFTGWRGRFDERRVAAGRFAVCREEPLLQERFADDLVGHFGGVIHRANAGFEKLPNTVKMDNVYLTLRMQRWNGRIASATSRIWPCVAPFMFREPMEIALAAPPSIRVRHRLTRRLIEYLDPRLSRMPLAEGYPAVPLRPGTAHLFWPQAVDTLNKVLKRAPTDSPASPENPLKRLWALEEVATLLEPRSMASADLYQPHALQQYLKNTREDAWRKTGTFGRIVSLELLSRAIRRTSPVNMAEDWGLQRMAPMEDIR
jgi:asparagine synthase (glutamine-hydrolysing)